MAEALLYFLRQCFTKQKNTMLRIQVLATTYTTKTSVKEEADDAKVRREAAEALITAHWIGNPTVSRCAGSAKLALQEQL